MNASTAEEKKPSQVALPEPLTLDIALQYAEQAHPDIAIARAQLDSALADRQQAEADNGIKASIIASSNFVDPASFSRDQDNGDHSVSLIARKNLYDFGRSDAALASADASIQGSRLAFQQTKYARQIEIMGRFFDVLLADLEFLRDNEAIAIDFIRFDRRQERQRLGQATELEVLELESRFQQQRVKLNASQARQRAARARLALAMNVPKQLPATLSEPVLRSEKRKIPSYEDLLQQAVDNNFEIREARSRLEAAREQLRAARAGDNPTLIGEASAQSRTREVGSSDRARIGITLEIPLTDGGSTRANVAKQLSAVHRWQAVVRQKEYDLREQVLTQWLELDRLRIERQRVDKLIEFTELNLDDRRLKYELELQADLGNAMTQITDAQLQHARIRYATELAWARLDAMLGKDPISTDSTKKVPPK